MHLCVLYECATEPIAVDGDPIAYCDQVDAKGLFDTGGKVSRLAFHLNPAAKRLMCLESRFKADIPAVSTFRAQYTSAKLDGQE